MSSLSTQRFWVTNFIVAAVFLLLTYQLLQLTVVRRDALRQVADRQHKIRIEMPPYRGQILDRNGKELATNLKVPSIYAVPRMIANTKKEELAQTLSQILEIKYDFIYKRLKRDKAFIWLKRHASKKEENRIRALKLPSLGIVEEPRRFYPQGDLLAHLLGFSNIDNSGLEGFELLHNRELQGRAGYRFTKRDALGREIKAFESKSIPALDGNKVILTIDQYIQYLTERALERSYTKWNAQAAWAVVMNVHTGEILAMVNRPTYNPNEYQNSISENRRNRAITDMYEPGSVFKIITASAALNEGLVTLDSEFDCEQGEYRYGSRILHDVHGYGMLTFPEVITKSSNIGTVKIAALLKNEKFYEYIRAFGIGEKTGVDFPGEASGFIRSPSQWSKTSPYNIPMGHEVLVTALQMTTAIGVIANGGELVQPYLVQSIEDQSGVTLKKTTPKIKRRVLRPEVAKIMQDILTRVVEEGTGKRARIDHIPVAGKTGTAQKVLPNGRGYSHDSFMSSFVGFAPADNPELAMVVVLDNPKPKYYGGTVAAPVFKEVVEAALIYRGYIPKNAQTLNGVSETHEFPENPPIFQPAAAAGRAL